MATGYPTLKVKNLAQIKEGEVEFGDFTLLVGPQASGKSIFLQMLKLVVDKSHITSVLKTNGYDWGRDPSKLFELVFGEGMQSIWKAETKVNFDGKDFHSDSFLPTRGKRNINEQLFYVIAQRVVTMKLGWPLSFGAFEIGDPYVIKVFSETIRVLMEKEGNLNGKTHTDIFPKLGRIQEPIRNVIDQAFFSGAKIALDSSSLKKRFLLNLPEAKLPFMVWSAGQKEFMPLLLSFYHLMPPSKVATRGAIKWVVIEEPEMGLHPQAIQSLMVVFLDLIRRGYKLVISTHSPVLLELAWAMRFMQANGGSSKEVFELIGIPGNPSLDKTFKAVIEGKVFRTYYFDRQSDGVSVKDISTLDPGSDDPSIADWGGLSSFAGRAGEVVAKLAANAQ